MILTNLLFRIGSIRTDSGREGTFFVVNRNQNVWAFTAGHVLEDSPKGSPVDIQMANLIGRFCLMEVESESDLCLFKLDCFNSNQFMDFTEKMKIEIDAYGAIPGMQLTFAGFPFGWKHYVNFDKFGKILMPFIKGAVLSNQDSSRNIFYVDGICNSGFSGSPLYYLSGGVMKVVGVMVSEMQPAGLSTGISCAKTAWFMNEMMDSYVH